MDDENKEAKVKYLATFCNNLSVIGLGLALWDKEPTAWYVWAGAITIAYFGYYLTSRGIQ